MYVVFRFLSYSVSAIRVFKQLFIETAAMNRTAGASPSKYTRKNRANYENNDNKSQYF